MNQDAPDIAPDAPGQPDAGPGDGLQKARVYPRWLIKMGLIMLVMFGFGVWGLVDALKVYPDRGHRAATFLEWQHLQKLREAGQLAQASVTDPKTAFNDLKARQKKGVNLSVGEQTRLAWLDSLNNTWMLDAKYTTIPRQNTRETVNVASERLDELAKKWTTSDGGAITAPKPLTFYDLPVQWAFVVIGFPAGLYLSVMIARVMKQRFTFDPVPQRLTLADGTELTPDQLADVDKRRWGKYMVSLIPAPPHPRAGQEIELDLLRHRELEDWVLAMEKTRFPERAAEAEALAQQEAERKAAEEGSGEGSEEAPAESDGKSS